MSNILLGLTGSVATTLAPKLVKALREIGNVAVVMTKRSENFICDPSSLSCEGDEFSGKVFTEEHEWLWSRIPTNLCKDPIWQKGDPVLHIELRKWADVMVVAPLSADTLAKFANGLCDSLLSSIFRAWDLAKPIVLAPAMNTMMLEHPITNQHLRTVQSWFGEDYNCCIVPSVEKDLACGDKGKGAMGAIEDIVLATKNAVLWKFPLVNCSGIPINHHPGAFGYLRHYSHHTGVDLYTTPSQTVRAVEGGRVVCVEAFTGPKDGSPQWNDTDAVLVEGKSGVVCYGEISPSVSVGKMVQRGDIIGAVKRVLKEGKERPDIDGHSPSMLHMELYKHGTKNASKSWKSDAPMHEYMNDPTPFLLNSIGAPKERLTWKGKL